MDWEAADDNDMVDYECMVEHCFDIWGISMGCEIEAGCNGKFYLLHFFFHVRLTYIDCV